MPKKPSLTDHPELTPTATYRELAGSSYIVLADGTVARKLKPRVTPSGNFWHLSTDGRIRVVSQKTIEHLKTFP